MPLATSRDHGHNLQTVQLLIKKNQVRGPFVAAYSIAWRVDVTVEVSDLMCTCRLQTLQKEIQGHQPRCDDIFERSQSVLQGASPNVEVIRQRLVDLQKLWEQMMEETEKRHSRLEEAHMAQQYYFDAAEAEAWMSEQELYMMSEEKAKVKERAVTWQGRVCTQEDPGMSGAKEAL